MNLRNITNSFQDVRLASLASWRQANEITPRDRGGPYVVMQEGHDPQDPKVIADAFVLGKSGKKPAIPEAKVVSDGPAHVAPPDLASSTPQIPDPNS